jgi:enamine deaminase RidA (YjgF/YER057c/UK114 family)
MGRMTLECIDPDDLPTPSTYTHVVVATGSRLVFVAGQEPEDEHGNLVGVGDLAVQARQVFARSRSSWSGTGVCGRLVGGSLEVEHFGRHVAVRVDA